MSMRLFVACGAFAALAACGGSATDAGLDVASLPDGCTATPDAVADGDATTPTVAYASVVIRDRSADPAFVNGKCGPSPGMDLDCVGLYRGGTLLAVGKTNAASAGETTTYTPGTSNCVNLYNSATSADGPLDGHSYADKPDTGYISLNGGAIEIHFGACVNGTNITNCDGAGVHVDIQAGDEIDVWELDGNYLTGSGTGADGNAWDGCNCYADEYEVDLQPTTGAPATTIVLPTRCEANSADGKWFAGSHTVKIP